MTMKKQQFEDVSPIKILKNGDFPLSLGVISISQCQTHPGFIHLLVPPSQENVTAALKFDSAFLGTEPPKVHHLRMVSTHRCHGKTMGNPGWSPDEPMNRDLLVLWDFGATVGWKQCLNCRESFDAFGCSFLCGMLLKCWWVWGSIPLGIGRMLNKYLTCGGMGPTMEAPKQILNRSR